MFIKPLYETSVLCSVLSPAARRSELQDFNVRVFWGRSLTYNNSTNFIHFLRPLCPMNRLRHRSPTSPLAGTDCSFEPVFDCSRFLNVWIIKQMSKYVVRMLKYVATRHFVSMRRRSACCCYYLGAALFHQSRHSSASKRWSWWINQLCLPPALAFLLSLSRFLSNPSFQFLCSTLSLVTLVTSISYFLSGCVVCVCPPLFFNQHMLTRFLSVEVTSGSSFFCFIKVQFVQEIQGAV